MFCANCGSKLSETSKFCPSCGTSVKTEEKTPAPKPAQSSVPKPGAPVSVPQSVQGPAPNMISAAPEAQKQTYAHPQTNAAYAPAQSPYTNAQQNINVSSLYARSPSNTQAISNYFVAILVCSVIFIVRESIYNINLRSYGVMIFVPTVVVFVLFGILSLAFIKTHSAINIWSASFLALSASQLFNAVANSWESVILFDASGYTRSLLDCFGMQTSSVWFYIRIFAPLFIGLILLFVKNKPMQPIKRASASALCCSVILAPLSVISMLSSLADYTAGTAPYERVFTTYLPCVITEGVIAVIAFIILVAVKNKTAYIPYKQI